MRLSDCEVVDPTMKGMSLWVSVVVEISPSCFVFTEYAVADRVVELLPGQL